MIAEESTAFPMVTKPGYDGGLGFNFKWNMGWMNDMLGYMSADPLFRKGRHNDLTFSLTYAFSENFILPLSHDEVVHGKCSLLSKMPGSYEEKFAGLRAYYGYMLGHPGKKMLFMGGELGQFIEWNEEQELDWNLLQYPLHAALQQYVADLNHLYCKHAPLHSPLPQWQGFQWVAADDADHSVISFRLTDGKNEILCIYNFSGGDWFDYRLGVPYRGHYRLLLSSDDTKYGGEGRSQELLVADRHVSMHGQSQSLCLRIPPHSAQFYIHRIYKKKS